MGPRQGEVTDTDAFALDALGREAAGAEDEVDGRREPGFAQVQKLLVGGKDRITRVWRPRRRM